VTAAGVSAGTELCYATVTLTTFVERPSTRSRIVVVTTALSPRSSSGVS